MKNVIYLFTFLIFAGCNTSNLKTEEEKQAERDSFTQEKYGMSYDERVKQMTDSIMQSGTDKVFLDTAGLSKAPVKVTKAVLFKKEYSNYRDIRLTYKNVSRKTITAIRFRWKGVNAFGEPADMGGAIEGYGSGFSDDTLNPGRTETGEWGILSKDGKKVQLAWPYEVAFSDGSKWTLEKL